jgi:hypothetical protein
VKARLERAVARVSGIGGVGKLEELRKLARQSWLQLRDSQRTTSAAPDSARTQAHASQKDCDVNRKDQNDDLAL